MDLVTGGAGFIGSHLVEELVLRGRPVRVLDNFSSGRLENLAGLLDRIEVIEADILAERALEAAMRGVERVFHQAALGSVPRSIDDPFTTNRVNVDGTLNVLRAARDAGCRRVVYASSSSVYGDGGAPVQREDLPTRPVSPYAVSKLAAEQYCRVFTRVYGLPTVALRYFNVFGPRQNPASQYAAVIARFVQAALAGESLPIHGDGRQSRDFTHVRNVVLANCLAGESDAAVGEAINIACGERHTILDIAETLRRILASQGVHVAWHRTGSRAGDVRNSLADVDKAHRLLGYTPVIPFGEGLHDTLEAGAALLDSPR